MSDTPSESSTTDQIAELLAKTPCPGNAIDLVRCARDIAQGCGMDGVEMMPSFALVGATATAAALAGIRSVDPRADGDVRLHLEWSGPRVMDVPVGRRLQPSEWMFGWAAAMITGDTASGLTLCAPQVLSALDAKDDHDGAAICAALAATQDPQADLDSHTYALDPETPLFRALQAIVHADTDDFVDAVHEMLVGVPDDPVSTHSMRLAQRWSGSRRMRGC